MNITYHILAFLVTAVRWDPYFTENVCIFPMFKVK